MKKIFAILAIAVMLLVNAAPAFASNVVYTGDSGDFIFEAGSDLSPTDLFEDFYNAMPGDVLTHKVTVKNNASEKVDVTIYMRAVGVHDGTEDGRESTEGFLEQLALSVYTTAEEPIFKAPADQTAQLTEWYCLGTIASGKTVDLDIILEIPIELEMQNAVGYIDWEFKVEEVPHTGDETNLPLLIGVFAASSAVLIALAVILIIRRKRSK